VLDLTCRKYLGLQPPKAKSLEFERVLHRQQTIHIMTRAPHLPFRILRLSSMGGPFLAERRPNARPKQLLRRKDASPGHQNLREWHRPRSALCSFVQVQAMVIPPLTQSRCPMTTR